MRPYAGKILRVDLSTGSSKKVDTSVYADRFFGGRGIATKAYWDEVRPDTGAFDEANRLIIATGPLAGIKGVGGSRWGIYSKSPYPLKEHFCYGNLGGSFGAELKFAGYDALIIKGKAEYPAILTIRDEEILLQRAGDLWGKSTVETIETLKEKSPVKAKILSIGPAGENLVSFATVFADGDASCAGGMGAVMGSKKLKAVMVSGSRRTVEVADGDRLREIDREIRGHGRGNVKVWGLDFMAHGENTKKLPCYGCPARCLRVKYTAKNGKSGKYMCQSRFFYMPHAWGFYGEENDVPFYANRLCDEYGLDTWELQGCIEWLLRCQAEGLLDEKRTGLPISKVGSFEFIQELVRSISRQKGFGKVIALGAEKAARGLGKEYLAQYNRNDPYDPRYCTINTLLYPFETREPIQQLHEAGLVLSQWSSWAKGVESAHISSNVVRGIAERFWGGEKAGDMSRWAGKAEAARRIQDRQYAKECLMVCDWMYPVFDIPNSDDHVGDPGVESRVVSAALGTEYSREDLALIGERVFNLQRAVLLREGHRALRDDFLPAEWHESPLETHVADPECIVPGPRGEAVSRIGEKIEMDDFLRIREEYYDLRGWDVPTGLQSVELLKNIGLGDVADELSKSALAVEAARSVPFFRRIINRAALHINGHRSIARSRKETSAFNNAAEPSIEGEALMKLLEEQREKFGNGKIAHNFKGWNKSMQYYFPDIDEYYVIRMVEGKATLPEKLNGPLDKPDIFYEMSTETLRAMTRGEISGLQAYKQRRLKLKASFIDMMKLQTLNNV